MLSIVSAIVLVLFGVLDDLIRAAQRRVKGDDQGFLSFARFFTIGVPLIALLVLIWCIIHRTKTGVWL